ncbi:MAG: TetR/AcrR family transcriptional regulator [Verrucomicrobia bacterium]|nr:TetR/AcrR family transcriptional regulator [Verrucomicrobiota bacterium]
MQTKPHDRRQSNESPAGVAARERIVAGARSRFFSHGFRGVTMDDLAEELGMSKKTLYAHFSSKTALLEAVLLDKFGGVETDLERITSESSADFLEALSQLLACVQRHTGEIQPPFLRDIRREAPDMFKLVESRRRTLIERHFGKLLGEGRRLGVIRKDVPANLILEILLGAVEAIMNPAKLEELNLAPKTAYSAIINVVFEGVVAATKSRKSVVTADKARALKS